LMMLVMSTTNIHPQSRSNEMQSRLNLDDTILTPEHRQAGDDHFLFLFSKLYSTITYRSLILKTP